MRYRRKKLRKKVKVFLYIVLIVVLAFIIKSQVHNVKYYLNGEKEIDIVVGTEYQDEGFSFLDKNKDVDNKKLDVHIDNNIDYNTLGKYHIIYHITYRKKNYKLERIVNIIDNIPPVIEIDEKKLIKNYCSNDSSEYKATDNYDGDITSNVVKKKTDTGVHYEVVDSSNNKTELDKEVSYKDQEKPVIKLKGDSTVYVLLNNEYNEPGYTVTDNCDAEISKRLVIDSNVDVNKEGTYEIKYSVTDLAGNKNSTSRKVIVSSLDLYNIKIKENDITSYVKKYNASVIYYDLTSGYKYEYKPDQVYFGASLIKTLAALYAYEKMNVTSEIRNLVEPTIMVSNNNTYVKLANKIGINNLKQYGKSLGMAYAKNLNSDTYYINTTANDQLIIWRKLWDFINSNEKGSELKEFFINDNARYLDFDGLPEVMHKYGLANGYYNDVGIVLDKKPYIIVVLTKEGNHEYGKIVNEISKLVYELHKKIK